MKHANTTTVLMEIKTHLKEIEQRIYTFKSLLEFLEGNHPELSTSNLFNGYRESWNWSSKITFILRRSDRPLKSKEILEYMKTIPDKSILTRRKVARTLSIHINKCLTNKRLHAYRVIGIKPHFYFLPEWLDKEGAFDKKYLDKIQLEM